ncbi:MAG: KilA-N domain-containing protein [Acidovorax temperans]|uniref:KilA-N domain-containing protein n=1 Tax=Acidovorax temperans TaxID=80878 RepID=UPI00391B00E4
MNNTLILDNTTIKTDSEGRYCLNDLHKAAGGDPKHKVPNWLRLDSTHDLIDEIARVSDVRLAPASSVHGGANQGTYVCKELVYAYAMWLAHAVVTLTDAHVARGQAAWSRIKATAAEQRELWRDVGEALLVGRRMHKADQKFSQWCKEMGFGDMDRRVRADAMWFATSGVQRLDTSESHPTRIRMWFNEQKTTETLPEVLPCGW